MLTGRSTNSKPRRVLAKTLAVLSLAIWFSFIALFEHYSATRPIRPDTSSGRIYQLNNHGSYVYLTKREQWRLWFLEFGGVPLFLAAVVLAKFWKIPTDPNADIPGHVRNQVGNRCRQDHKAIKSTYTPDKNKDDAHRHSDRAQ